MDYLSWFKAHERLVVIALVLSAGTWGFNKWINTSAKNSEIKAALAEQQRAGSDAQLKIYEQQVAQLSQTVAQQTAAWTNERTLLIAAIASRDATSQKQVQQINQIKTPVDAVKAVESVYQLAEPIVPTDIGAIVPTVDLQQFATTKVEHDTLQLDLKDTTSQLQTATQLLTTDSSFIETLKGNISAAKDDLQKHDQQCQADKKELKAEARKGKWHAFVEGMATAALVLAKFAKF